MKSLDHLLGEVIPRMTEAHWKAMAYVEKFGCYPRPDEASDLIEWGLIKGLDETICLTTDLGDLVLEEEPSLAGY
jgi:hypothetical protein